ncbi:hypothetical protein GPECTOR_32g497 [Gonium pectorale]|uniref:Fibrocystin-L n=1 Tax=Gonium pectorale TaxID=33097 RepID=A0A150GDG7_GONPE|nr:hypothetical protein GPECTOR_32g497 [Gonium pectorale]|eukprot:KXZ47884.1 hypothetical protein GPECTOR_32g497 [Gonium pectorale]
MGAGFSADRYNGSNVVFIGPYPCTVVNHLTSDTLVRPVGPGTETVTYYRTYSYDAGYTPTVFMLWPSAGPPGTPTLILNDPTWYPGYECGRTNELYADNELCLGTILVGDFLADVPNRNNAFQSFGSFSYYGFSAYSINVTTPTPASYAAAQGAGGFTTDGATAQSGVGTAGSANVTVVFEGSLRGGQPVVQRSAYRTAADGTPYMFQTYAEVTAVSPSRGSLAGGTLVTISGRGFPTLSLRQNDSVVVTIAGAPCRVVSSTYSQLVCETGPRPATYQPPRPLKGLYPGMRGIEYELYGSYIDKNEQMWRLNTTVMMAESNRSYSTIITDRWTTPPLDTSITYASYNTKSFFVAPRDGIYTFHVSCDDDCILNGTYVLPNGSVASQRIAYISGWSTFTEWFKYPATQQSAPLALTAGQAVLLEGRGSNGGGPGGINVGVTMPSPDPKFNSVAEMQTIMVTGASRARQVSLKYSWAAGIRFVFNLTITAPSAADMQVVLDYQEVGVELTMNTRRVARFTLRNNAREMANFVAWALGVSTDSVGALIDNSFNGTNQFRVQASVVPAPLPAITPGGSWNLWITDSRGTALSPSVSMPWNAPIAALSMALEGMMPGLYKSIGFSSSTMEGGYLTNTWTITYSIYDADKMPHLAVSPGANFPASGAFVTSAIARNASIPLNGNFRVSYGPYCEYATINTWDTAADVQTKLTKLPGMGAPLSVTRSGDAFFGISWLVTFDPLVNPGNLPLLRVIDASNVTGTDVRVYVTEYKAGSTDQFFGPLPTEFTALAVASPVELSVVVNNVPSACGHPAGGPGCTFTYDQALTPSVTAVSPNLFVFSSNASQEMTITGTGFNASAQEIQVFLDDNTTCAVTSASATTVVCRLPPTVAAGSRTVQVRVGALGFPAATPEVMRIAARTLAINGISYPSIAPRGNGALLLNVSGRGFDSVNCDRNTVSVGGSPCGVVACSWAQLQVLCSGPAAATAANVSIAVSVFNASGVAVDSIDSSASGVRVLVDPTWGPRINIASSLFMPSSGGPVNITYAGGGVDTWPFAKVWLLPGLNLSALDFSSGSQYDLLSGAFRAGTACSPISYDGLARVSCYLPYIPNGVYGVALEPIPASSSAFRPWLLAPEVLTIDMAITGVLPRVGSIGGGTELVITGSGFAPGNRSGENVVLIPVPVSTTFLNGLVVCDVTSATATQIRCRTRPHLATDADATDPMAFNTQPRPSGPNPGPIRVVACGSDATLSSRSPAFDINKFYCAFMPTSARAAACRDNGGDMSACSFSYTWDVTPLVTQAYPSMLFPGETLTVNGMYFNDAAALELRRADGTVGGTCSPPSALLPGSSPFLVQSYSSILCAIGPNVPAGVYQIVIVTKAGGYGGWSVDPDKVGRVAVLTRLTAVIGGVGSLGGGGSLTLRAAGAGFNASVPRNNKVFVDALPCNVTSVSTTSLTCTLPAVPGNVKAEYWNHSAGVYQLDLESYTNPALTSYITAINNQYWSEPTYLTWRAESGPDPTGQLVSTDNFLARFTFYMPVNQSATYQFSYYADDAGVLYVDDVMIGYNWQTLRVALTPGLHKFVVYYWESGVYALFDLNWDAGDGKGANRRLPWSTTTPFPPATPIAVNVTVNGVPAVHNCSNAAPLALAQPGSVTIVPEDPTELSVPAPVCAYVFSSYLTPYIANTTGIVTPLPNITTLTGVWLTENVSDISISIAGSPLMDAVLVPTGQPGVANLSFTLPSLPGFTLRTLNITVKGRGAVRMTPNISAFANTLRFPAAFTGYSLRNVSFGGGTDWTINGYGFVPLTGPLNSTAVGRMMTVGWTDTRPMPGQVAQFPLGSVVVFANTTQLVLRIPRLLTNYTSWYTEARGIYVMVSDLDGTSSKQWLWLGISMDYRSTPFNIRFSPNAVAVNTATTFNVTWSLRQAYGTVFNFTPSGQPSRATISLTPTPAGFPTWLNYTQPYVDCTTPTVISSAYGAQVYNETLNCTLPDTAPANVYTLWVCLSPGGCYAAPGNITVPMTVTSISLKRGAYTGGMNITINGTGFASNVSAVNVTFGPANCTVLSTSYTSITCLLGSALAPSANSTDLPTLPSIATVAPLSIIPSEGAPPQTFTDPAFLFTFDPTITPVVRSVSVNRGSTEGLTALSFNVLFGSAGIPNATDIRVQIGNLTCLNIAVASARGVAGNATVTCRTPRPTLPIPYGPQPIFIGVVGRGLALCNLTYEYVNLWSRRTTWGGNPPPEGYGVYIPANTTVVLDMSPPLLTLLVVEGTLAFDDRATTEIELRVKYILIRGGGQLLVGSETTPYPGRAKITLVTQPHVDIELPLYGSKVIAVRDGKVVLHGQHKEPTWTRLAATADVGASSILLAGRVNWRPGDVIAIASSSFYTNESETATITAAFYEAGLNVTMVDLSAKLNFTHLGVIEPVAYGQANGATIDMRAEVAVLTRNVVLQGDENSEAFMFGGTVMVSTPPGRPRAHLRFEQAEVRQTGQAFRLGRYTLHFHMHGDLAYNSWIRGCAIHHTYNRALTIHGSHRVLVQDNVAYNVMGHAFFLEDGIETGNIFEGNLGMYTRVSSALLNTDTTPATFWITNPNNTYRNNVAAGSDAYGYWVRLLDNPEGPSYTTSVCPKFTPLGVIQNNVAHSNMFYGFRIHPEYYPKTEPCRDMAYSYNPVTAMIDGLTSYKNGMKGAIATQVGLVIFANLTAADNGGGPLQHVVNGKDNGACFEMTWIVDDRNRVNVNLTDMAGLRNAVLISRTMAGYTGTAGRWPSGRLVTGMISQSAPMGHYKHSALMSMVNVTFVDWTGGRFYALEGCGKCKTFQGGATVFTSSLSFVQSYGGYPALSQWSWGHQVVFLDTDGSLVNARNVPPEIWNAFPWPVGAPGATWHSAVENELFDPVECTYVRGVRTSNDGAFCSPDLIFRRVMLNQHTPSAIMFRDLLVTSVATNRTSVVHFTKYNEDGYQFTAATRRDYWVHWDTVYRADPDVFRLHKLDPMDRVTGWMHMSSKYVRRMDRVDVNGANTAGAYPSLPPPTAPHGAAYYNKSFSPNSWWWGNFTYNDTKFTVFMKGDTNGELRMQAQACPVSGCNLDLGNATDLRGTLYWSDTNTWLNRPGGKPKAGENVTVPFGWNLIVDEDTEPLADLVVLGNITFSPTGDTVLTANNIFVVAGGRFYAGSRAAPFPATGKATIRLTGGRQDNSRAVDSSLVLGSKFLAAFRSGTLDLHGRSVGSRWTRLGASAPAGSSAIALASPQPGWDVGSTILITSSDYNVWHAEERTVVAVQNNGATLLLDSPLSYPHYAWTKSYANASAAVSSPPLVSVDMRAEVALLSSNIVIEAAEGPGVDALGGEYYGCRVLAHGASVARLSNVALRYCGQAGLDVPAVLFDRLASVPSGPSDPPGGVPNPSYLIDSVVYHSVESALVLRGPSAPVNVTGNVMYFSHDKDTVEVTTTGNYILNNLALGTLKAMAGNSAFDTRLHATFRFHEPNNYIAGNVAAGSERVGFHLHGPPCSAINNGLTGSAPVTAFRGYFLNNSAHSSLAGMVLKSSSESVGDGCTAVRNFTSYLSWDFDVITVHGIETDVLLRNVYSLNPMHAGILILKKGGLTEDALVTMVDGLVAGRTHPEVCGMCATLSDPGCHPKLSLQSYNMYEPFTPAIGLLSSSFGTEFTKGPDAKPWDGPKGYQTILGRMHVNGTTFADWQGNASCGGGVQAAYAIGNHAKMPDAFHPHYFSRSNVINVLNNGSATGLFQLWGPEPKWRNEADCGFQTFKQPDGSILELNCAGPKHVHFRDLDGTLTGTRSTVVGTYNTRRTFPYDQGTPIIPGPCAYSAAQANYMCFPNSSAYGLPDVSMKPVPTPVGGIGGNQHLFVLESRDGDSEDRNFGPVMFNVSGSIDLVVAAMDQGWCFAYTCQKRLSTFWTYLPMGHTVGVNFTGTPATVFRLWLPYAAPEDELVLEIYYMMIPNSQNVEERQQDSS